MTTVINALIVVYRKYLNNELGRLIPVLDDISISALKDDRPYQRSLNDERAPFCACRQQYDRTQISGMQLMYTYYCSPI